MSSSAVPFPTRAELSQELVDIEREIRRRRWLRDPDDWVTERLGEHIWSKQKEIMRSVRDHRRTACPSCHEAGKSYVASRIAGWWLDTHKPGEAFVVTSATTGDQVKGILWSEIGQMFAKGALPGRVNQTEWYMTVVQPNGQSSEVMVAVGRKPSEYNPTAFQGYHRRYVLVIFDEACGIPGGSKDAPHSLWEAADSLIANADSRFLAIGNPDDPQSEFASICRPNSGWNVIGIDAFETPNFTGEEIPEAIRSVLISPTWVEEKKAKWGEDNPLWISKVRGKFPDRTADGLIPMSWLLAAQDRDLEPKTAEEEMAASGWPVELGMDVGGGSDRNVVALRHGPIVRIIRRDQQPDTMKSCGNLLSDLAETNAALAKVDYIGIGKGVVDRARELGRPVHGVNVGWEAKNKELYANLKAEGWWSLRDRFESGEIDLDPRDEDLIAQLADIRFDRSSTGKISIESKDAYKRRNKESPDDADAVMLAFLPKHLFPIQEVREVEILWG